MPKRELDLFERSLTRARDMMGLASSLANTTSGVMDVSDVHRAAFVQGVSAFDTFVHEEIRARILDIFASGSPMPKALQKFRVSLASVQIAVGGSGLGWLETEIREQHALLSFQKPDKVADAVRLISDVQLWKALAGHLGQGSLGGETGDLILKRRLTLIADRRNTIVHQSDLDPTPPGDVLYPMARATVEDALLFLDQIARGIQAVT
ncbi:Uncharacterised protein [Mycobacteroides abscessus subsp. massiliense]|nr:hypothetical protein BAB77_03960 [Mycobacteroides abscessus]OTR04174.1 hypothetical protein B9M84_03695 [Mycobacteroides abscessus]SLC59825.1 Uncharacterised protein [Mycobacteroides abscessus subsp. massiliense]SLG63708.1 Uncharacterised protein [Mycobacteroides abscessus subsp. massiliense]SLH56963.1 Uncharacterised protein [Mycobacteroides abscessus subsp. massiliense]